MIVSGILPPSGFNIRLACAFNETTDFRKVYAMLFTVYARIYPYSISATCGYSLFVEWEKCSLKEISFKALAKVRADLN